MLSTESKSSSNSRISNISGNSNNGGIPLSKNSLQVLERRYLIKNQKGKPVEKPNEMFRRITKNIAEADAF